MIEANDKVSGYQTDPFYLVLPDWYVYKNLTKLPFYEDKDLGLMLYGCQIKILRSD